MVLPPAQEITRGVEQLHILVTQIINVTNHFRQSVGVWGGSVFTVRRTASAIPANASTVESIFYYVRGGEKKREREREVDIDTKGRVSIARNAKLHALHRCYREKKNM